MVQTPSFTGTSPVSPSNISISPTLIGNSIAGSTVKIYSDVGCTGTLVASGIADTNGAFSIGVVAAPNFATTFHATAVVASSTSACSVGITYVHDDKIPGAPTGLATTPTSPADDNAPTVTGSAEPGATVRIYTDATCVGAIAASGVAGPGGSFAVSVGIAEGSTTTFHARARDAAGNVSSCSASSVTYTDLPP